MANNQYINRVDVVRGGVTDTLINIADTTATASDVASGKYFYLATGERVQGTATGGSYQDGDNLAYGGAFVGSAIVGSAILSS